MNSDKKILYTSATSYLGVLLLACFLLNNTVRTVLLAFFSLLAVFIALFLIKKRSILELQKRQVALVMGAIAVISVMTYFLSGIKFGFYNSGFFPSFLWKYALPTTVAVISAEITRSVFLAQNDKLVTVLSYISFVLVDVLLLAESNVFAKFEYFMDALGLVLLPAFAANVLYHYIASKYGALPNILYKLILFLYPYLIPIKPQISNALLSFARIFLPIGILFLIHILYTPKTFVVTRRSMRIQAAITSFLMILSIGFMLLISSQFQYKTLVIATESMAGELDKGDVIIYDNYDGQYIENGQVIVFERDGATIIHRVVDIKKINGVLRYYTKGDANESMDSGYITDADIIGIINLKIKYIGYPTLWVRSLFE